MCKEVCDFVLKASKQYCEVYKCQTFDRIAEDHAFMDVTPFVSVIVQNICTLEALLASHQVGWLTVPLQIMMVPVLLTEVTAVPSHLEFIHYFMQWSLHIQQATQESNPQPLQHPKGISIESEQEGVNAKPKDSPLKPSGLLSKPPAMPAEPLKMPTKHL